MTAGEPVQARRRLATTAQRTPELECGEKAEASDNKKVTDQPRGREESGGWAMAIQPKLFVEGAPTKSLRSRPPKFVQPIAQ